MILRNLNNIEIFFPPCHPGEVETMNIQADCNEDISPVFPYLNSIMKGTIYNKNSNSINFKYGERMVTLQANKLLVTKLKTREEAYKALDEIKELINETWDRRDKIEPSYKTRAQLGVLDIFKILPKTNCGDCGESTCMAFAAKIVNEEITIDRCIPVMTDKKYDKNRAKLIEILDEAGYAVPTQ